MSNDETFPRELTRSERELLVWLLPEDRPGYRMYRELVVKWKVVARGRRGEGNYILGEAGRQPDTASPLPQVFAYGVVEYSSAHVAVTVRERLDDQIEFEIVNLDGERIPDLAEEKRRWSYSSWLPSAPCPQCLGALRKVEMKTGRGLTLVLAICAFDQRLWVFDASSGVSHPIPVTNFYNELMLQKNVRDPKIALNARRLFSDLSDYEDSDLVKAFVTYNALRTKILLDDRIVLQETRKQSMLQRIVGLLHP